MCPDEIRRQRIVAAARARVGARFRPQGRGHDGYDCVGLVLEAAMAAGIRIEVRSDYRLSGHDPEGVARRLAAIGFAGRELARPGDLLVCHGVRGRVHFAIWAGATLIEANAGIGRVVERTLVPGEGFSPWAFPPAGDPVENKPWAR